MNLWSGQGKFTNTYWNTRDLIGQQAICAEIKIGPLVASVQTSVWIPIPALIQRCLTIWIKLLYFLGSQFPHL